MAELGETTDPRALVPGDVEGMRVEIALCNRYAASLCRTGDGLKQLDTGAWRGEAAEKFHDSFQGHPVEWLRAGDCFRDAADALAEYVEVIEWARGRATEAVALWDEAEATSPRTQLEPAHVSGAGLRADPGDERRAAALDLLNRTRQQVDEAGHRAGTILVRLAGIAPVPPGFWGRTGDVLAEVGTGLGEWVTDFGAALSHLDALPQALSSAVTHPMAFAKNLVSWEQFHTNPARWVGHVVPDVALTLAGGAGVAKKGIGIAGGLTKTGRANRLLDRAKFEGKGIADHVANGGADIGKAGRSRKCITRNVPDAQAVRFIFDDLSRGGRAVENPSYGGGTGRMVELPDGSRIGIRENSKSSPDPTLELIHPNGDWLKIHTER